MGTINHIPSSNLLLERQRQRNPGFLDIEALPAPARGFCIRVLKIEPSADELVRVVQLEAEKVEEALRIDDAPHLLRCPIFDVVIISDVLGFADVHHEDMPEQPPERTPMRMWRGWFSSRPSFLRISPKWVMAPSAIVTTWSSSSASPGPASARSTSPSAEA
eukprot:CAMPEP_0172644894 /NCGR_PEP_ID=MMETSP1068-20121228/239449_1 /TAXON_ID=35684 /ORGANISM="Pseudopedinella elastica, Strain CCMP716" /LENGTH=161 /DNA_ID=CAMNT_0013459113 /DNA_START=423 /DNA_END=909 /DNA_ORIENTATION=-